MSRTERKNLQPLRSRWTLAIVSLAALGVLGGCGGGVSPEQKAALARISELGGRVNFKRGGYEVDLTQTPVEDNDLMHLQQIPNLKNVDLQGTRISDEAVEHLRPISTLEIVYLQRTRITRDAAESLKKSLPKAEVNY